MQKKNWVWLPISFAVASAWAGTDTANQTDNEVDLAPVVVTGVSQTKAATVKFNPKAAIQPMPAGDGADLLKSVPNMSVIRKGGSSGDPLFRGLGGSRLMINADDQFIYGGCGGRMDPPTAYIFPSNFDEVIVTKGPQSVTQGAGLVAGSVRFVRKKPDFSEKNYSFDGNFTLGSNDRRDAVVEAAVGSKYGYVRADVSHNEADDYRDGAGNRVHSHFKRDSQVVQLGATPTENTEIVGTYERSRGKAAYADRMMDGSKFDRDAWNVRFTQRNITPWFSELELIYGHGKVDHVMDNYSLRAPKMMMGKAMKMVGNPKRETDTGRLKATFDWDNVNLQTGMDYMNDKHSGRGGSVDYVNKPYIPDQSFKQWGIFAEAAWQRTENQKWVAGYRHDNVRGTYETYADNDPDKKQTYHLDSGFVRWEQNFGGTKYYAGLGVAERAPDYWERNRSDSLKAERNQQFDAGAIWNHNNVQTTVSLFASDIHNFILVDNNSRPQARNINARRYGGEAEVKWRFAPQWTIGSSLAYTYGKNRTDDIALAQTPPLDWKTSLTWDNGKFSAGALWRVAAAQHRYAKGQGNIVGQDIGEASGFGVLSLNAGWRINKHATLQAGVDNVFDKAYAESVSRSGAFVDPAAGLQTTRVNEPGRTGWLRLQAQF